MKRVFYVFALLIAVVLVPQSAFAVNLATQATVTVVEGIVITETTALDFGSLVSDDGSVVLNADGTVTDANNLVFDAAEISPGAFSVQSVAGQEITVSATVDNAPAGITVSSFTMAWNAGAGAAVGDHTMANATDTMALGAEIAVAKATVTTGVDQIIDYTLTMVFK